MGSGKAKPLSEIVFEKYDTDKSGEIDAGEFRNLCYSLGYGLTSEEVELGVKVLDSDGSGKIEMKEFTTWWTKADRWADVKLDVETLEKRSKALDTFKSFDPSKTSKIKQADFEKFYASLIKEGLTKKTKEKFLEDLDTNKDGAIEFGEYLDWLARQGSLAQKLPEKK